MSRDDDAPHSPPRAHQISSATAARGTAAVTLSASVGRGGNGNAAAPIPFGRDNAGSIRLRGDGSIFHGWIWRELMQELADVLLLLGKRLMGASVIGVATNGKASLRCGGTQVRMFGSTIFCVPLIYSLVSQKLICFLISSASNLGGSVVKHDGQQTNLHCGSRQAGTYYCVCTGAYMRCLMKCQAHAHKLFDEMQD